MDQVFIVGIMRVQKGAMNMENALNWVADLFEEPVEKISLQTSQEEIPGWDSLGVLTLLADLDEDFDIILTEDEILEMKSVQDIINVLTKHEKLIL